ncbi:hypothetical protein [Streptomyces katrae]|uniref:hypothetical protein n=1 Tax=Streptomyces katrae TaxID=68223 RepID=UPI0004BEEA73|nr:hypothetical protein [Streptomyces katrae]
MEYPPATADAVPGLRGEPFDRTVAEQAYKGWAGEAEKAFETTGAQGTRCWWTGGAVGAKDGALFDAAAIAEALKGVGICGAAAGARGGDRGGAGPGADRVQR